MVLRMSDQVNEHGRRLIDNDDHDYASYLVKRLSPTQHAYVEFLSALFGDLGSLDPERIVYLAVALHTHFQAGTWWNDRKREYRPGSGFNDGNKTGPKPPGTPKPATLPKPPKRKPRQRQHPDIVPPY
jgi:hypothetical protein